MTEHGPEFERANMSLGLALFVLFLVLLAIVILVALLDVYVF